MAVSAAEPEPRQPRQLCQPRLRHKMPRRVGTTLILAAVCCWSTTAVIGADMAAPEQSTDDAPADDAGVILLGAAVVLALSAILLVAVINRDRMGTESAELTASDLQDTGRRTSYHTILAMSHAKRYAVDGGMESESEVEEISELTESELAVYRSGRRSTSYHAALAPCAVKILSRFVAQGLAHDKEKSMQATDGKPGTYFYSKGKKSSEPSETGRLGCLAPARRQTGRTGRPHRWAATVSIEIQRQLSRDPGPTAQFANQLRLGCPGPGPGGQRKSQTGCPTIRFQ